MKQEISDNEKNTTKDEESSFYEMFCSIFDFSTVGASWSFLKENRPDSIAGLIMLVGVLIVPYNPNIGGIIVGVIGGFYLFREISQRFFQIPKFYKTRSGFKSYVAALFSIAMVLLVPGMLTALLIGSVTRYVVDKGSKESRD